MNIPSGIYLLCLLLASLTFISTKSNKGKLSLPSPGEEEFHEELYVQTLHDGFVNTHFQFSTRWRYGQKQNRKFRIRTMSPKFIDTFCFQFTIHDSFLGPLPNYY